MQDLLVCIKDRIGLKEFYTPDTEAKLAEVLEEFIDFTGADEEEVAWLIADIYSIAEEDITEGYEYE